MRWTLLIAMLMLSLSSTAQCERENEAFKHGEVLNYDLYYNWKFVWVKAGSAQMDITQTRYHGKSSFKANLITRGSKQADKIFIFRDTLVSYCTDKLVPLYYKKAAREGKRYYIDEVWYTYPEGKNVINNRHVSSKGVVSKEQLSSNSCIYDMVSMLLQARSFDASKYKVGYKIKFPMTEGSKIVNETVIYRGKKVIEVNDKKKYNTLVFSFVEYDKKNKEKEVITFYITDDKNHIPIRLDMFLSFGSAKVILNQIKGNRHPLTSIVKEKKKN